MSSFQMTVTAEEDVIPPEILSYTIAPGEYTVGDTVPVEVVVKDNVTEQNRVYLYLKKPKSGNSLNVWLTYVGDGRYQGELMITEGMEAGVYHLHYISAIDDQGNAYTLWGDDKGQSITTFDTNEDVSPPEILSYTIAPGEYTVGDTVPVEVVVKDNVTEQNRVYLYLKKPKSGNSLNVWLTYVGDGRYQGELTIMEGMEAGVYHLHYISTIDDQGNAYTLWGDDKGQSITMFDTNEDVSPPEILSYTIAPGEYTVGDTVPVEVVVKDNVTEQNRVYLYLKKPKSGNSLNVWLTYVGDDRYQGELMITEGMEAGMYQLNYISAIDDQGNAYTLWGTDDYHFSFRYPSTDTVAPTFNRLEANDVELDEHDTSSFTVHATDDLKLKSAEAVFVNGEERITLSSSLVTPEGFHFDLNRSDFPEGAGKWALHTLTLTDLNQNTTTVSDGFAFTVTTLPKIEPVNAIIVSSDDWWSYMTVNQDVYIMPGATLILGQNTILNGNVYVGGRLRLTGGVQAKREIRASNFTFGYYYPYQDGMVTMSGSNSISSMIATNNLYGTLPFRLSETPVFETNGTVNVSGSYVPLGTLFVNGEVIQAKANGTFRLTVPTPSDNMLRFTMTDQFGKIHRWTYKVYSRDLPVVTTNKNSGIYLQGETVELTTTKQATIYVSKNDASPQPYTDAMILGDSVTLTAYSVDEAELTSESVTRRYEVFHVNDVTNRDTSIQGKAEPGTELTVTLGSLPVQTTAKPDGTFVFEGLELNDDTFTIQAKHGLFTSDVYTKPIRDVLPPVVSGITNGASVATPVTLSFNEGTATLNGKSFGSGETIDEDGTYTLVVRDTSGNETTRQFTIDQTAPIITGVTDRALLNQAVTVTFNEGTATLNGKPFAGGSVNVEGTHVIRVVDLVGNATLVTFTIDLTAPVLEGIDQTFYQDGVTPVFTEGVAKLNGQPFTSGTRITAEGAYTLRLTDAAGNETTREFTIDRTPVTVNGVADGLTKDVVTPTFTEGTATLNGKPYTSGIPITADGAYALVVTDQAGNTTTHTFTIDRTAPLVTGVTNGTFNQDITPVFEETATLNGQAFASGTIVTEEGTYVLVVTDQAGNATDIRFTIDRTKVEVSGVEDGKTFVRATPRFSEGKATLNGVPFTSGQTITKDGSYTLRVVDEAGNETVVRFTIDATPPVLNGLTKGKTHYREVAPLFTEGAATLNGQPFVSGTRISREGVYTLRLVDAIGNETVETFTIDRTRPVVTGVTANQLTNQTVTIRFNEGTATLNGKAFRTNTQVSASGTYALRVTDAAGNYSSISFTIDKVGPTKPTILTLTNKSTRVTGKTEAGATVLVTYDGRTYTTKASSTGVYAYNLKTTKPGATVSVRARDAAGNTSSLTSTKVLNTFSSFTINAVKSTQTVVTGKGNRNATVQAFVGTKAISKPVKVDAKGNYRLTIPKQKTGTVITVNMTQTGYEAMKKTSKVVR
ncbi:Ig-like domain-containing protein [Exiguobacterium aurantiacum]|nr:Ig-like domain-containing protein [Exiguobacterium aurantiacum]